MVSIVMLWLPIVVSAVIVFFASFVIHMVLPYHRGDHRKLRNEDEVMAALRKFQIEPGDYMMPCATTPAQMREPNYLEKRKQGPIVLMTVIKPGGVDMRESLSQWFAYCLLVGVFAAYVAGRALPAGTGYLPVFRFAGVTAFVGYALALWQNSIWYKRSWGTTLSHTFDGLVYGLLTAGTFGWLWPK